MTPVYCRFVKIKVTMRIKILGVYQVMHLLLLLSVCVCNYEVCNRRPLGTNTDPLPPDNRFLIDVDDIRDNMYIPKTEYTVRLFSRDPLSTFIAFTISLGADTMENKNNPRKPIRLLSGKLEPLPNSNTTVLLSSCNNTVIQSDITPKNSVEAKWTAPDKGNKCVTIFAVVAVKPDVWYSFEGPLSKRICEDRRKADDMLPMENEHCTVCEDARYQLTFEGMWSYNTHPDMFPGPNDMARFSDVVGASHNKAFSLFKYNSEATPGLQLLAEQGNTTNLEIEIYEKLGTDVRTIIKAIAPPHTNMMTLSTFRASPQHHLVSLATAIVPSPDWFLGVANLELCDAKTNGWANNITFNLYPMDAGTDSGKKFSSSNEATAPAQPISSAEIATNIPKEQIRPFARLVLHLIRTYYNPNCAVEPAATSEPGQEGDDGGHNGNDNGGDGDNEPYRPEYRPPPPPTTTTTSEEPPTPDPESPPECPMTAWDEWQACEGECINNKRDGYMIRFRSHIGNPAPECSKMSLTETQHCEEDCEEEVEEEDNEEEVEEK